MHSNSQTQTLTELGRIAILILDKAVQLKCVEHNPKAGLSAMFTEWVLLAWEERKSVSKL